MKLWRTAHLLWRRIAGVVRKPAPEPSAPPPSPSPEIGTVLPPPLAPARDRYILVKSGEGAFDVYDGEEMIGDLYRQDGDGDRKTVWIATLAQARFDRFMTLKAAKDWLGQPPVRKYRREAHSKRSRWPARRTMSRPAERQS